MVTRDRTPALYDIVNIIGKGPSVLTVLFFTATEKGWRAGA